MDRRTKIELLEGIRRGYAATETIRELAWRHRVHRRMVRQAIASAVPPNGRNAHREQLKLGLVKEFIDKVLAADREESRKRWHTAHPIWMRLRQEGPEHPVGEATVREYLQRGKQERGLTGRELFVPPTNEWGQVRTSGLVRGRGSAGRRAAGVAVLPYAHRGTRRWISSGLHQSHAVGVSRRARARILVLRQGLSHGAPR
jgi:hypothetical protein